MRHITNLPATILVAASFGSAAHGGAQTTQWIVSDVELHLCQKNPNSTKAGEKWCVVYEPKNSACKIITSDLIRHADLGAAFQTCLNSKK